MTTNNNNNVCAWCGTMCSDEFCTDTCRVACMEAYEVDMLGMQYPTLMEVHGDTPMAQPTSPVTPPMCPVCDERHVEEGLRTCLATTCREQWDMAWAMEHHYTRVVD